MRVRSRLFPGVAIATLLALVACRPGGLATSSLAAAPPAPPPVDDEPPPMAAPDRPLLPAGPRITLTASDGTGLALAALSAKAVLEGPLAFTEMHLVFNNPLPRTLEGTFKVVLPVGASVSRFALRIGDAWQEGEVVERQHARAAYEDFLHKKQDPALLEQSAGNEFAARVFPIPPNGTKELVLSYAEELTGRAPYVLALRGLPQIGAIDATASAAGAPAPLAALARADWTPDADFVVDRRAVTAGDGLRADDLVVTRVRPVAQRRLDPMTSEIVLVDTSASRALGLKEEVDLLRQLAAAAAAKDPDSRWVVACFDQRVDEVFAGRVADFDDAAGSKILARGALGASDLGRALAWAGGHANDPGATRVLLMTDGVATAGETDRAKLVAAARGAGARGIQRIDAIATGGIRDDASLHAIATAGLPRDGVVLDDSEDPRRIAWRLGEAAQSAIAVKVDGASWWYPQRIDGAQAGDEFLVYAEAATAAPVRVSAGDARDVTPDLRPADKPLLDRAFAQAKIASLLDAAAHTDDPETARGEIIRTSTSHRVLSPYTGFLVLETDADYARLGIDRGSLVDVLAVQGGRVVSSHRSTAVIAKDDTRTARAKAARSRLERSESSDGAPERVRRLERSESSDGAPKAGLTAGDPNAPAAPWGRVDKDEAPHGPPPARATAPAPAASTVAFDDLQQGIGDAFGAGGLGLSGTGEGGGGALAARPAATAAASPPAPRPARRPTDARFEAEVAEPVAPPEPKVAPYTGRFADVMGAVAARDGKRALATARAWHAGDPADVMGLVALGEALEASGDGATAARAYGSIVDLFPSRADMRRMAGERLERLADESALDLAVDTYEKALEQRPDHPSSHRMLAFALLRRHDYARAFEAALDGLAYAYPQGRFLGVQQVLREDLGLIGAAWAKAEPERRASILARVRAAGGTVEDAPSVRFVLSWETDANDVDLHVTDASGEEAYYQHPSLTGGGSLYADVTTGYGPECFTIRLPRGKRSARYTLQANYYARGPMGYGMGMLEVVDHDGHGGITMQERPFVVMNDHATVDLGRYQ
ncbi:MAG TPA: VIT domain-containing protein [Polyangiaceae bacterium]|nr:VIT domain-containing protein [Polyangiaceae bacterium]